MGNYWNKLENAFKEGMVKVAILQADVQPALAKELVTGSPHKVVLKPSLPLGLYILMVMLLSLCMQWPWGHRAITPSMHCLFLHPHPPHLTQYLHCQYIPNMPHRGNVTVCLHPPTSSSPTPTCQEDDKLAKKTCIGFSLRHPVPDAHSHFPPTRKYRYNMARPQRQTWTLAESQYTLTNTPFFETPKLRT